jgi:3-phosphoshikimate 1-carboxyvinyltransferase
LNEELVLENYAECSDVVTLEQNLSYLGWNFIHDADQVKIIRPKRINDAELCIKDAATAFRFLAVRLATLAGNKFSLDLSTQLKKRPHKILAELLQEMGALGSHKFPWQIVGKNIRGGKLKVASDISSQFISALLLSAPSFSDGLNLSLSGKIVSQPYIELTIKLMKKFGVEVEVSAKEIVVKPGQKYLNPQYISIEPDYSTLCYFWAWSLLMNREVVTQGNPRESLQADAKFVDILRKIGADLELNVQQLKIIPNKIMGGKYGLNDMPDQVPTLAVLALFADQTTIIKDIAQLRYKESDRIAALISELGKLTKITYEADQLIIEPLSSYPSQELILKCYDDHRLVMAFSILQQKVKTIKLDKINSVDKSAPEFFQILEKITTKGY